MAYTQEENLFRVIRNGDEFMKFLNKDNVNALTPETFLHSQNQKFSLLETAIQSNNVLAVNILIERNVDLSAYDIDRGGFKRQHEPLAVAINSDSPGSVKQLLMADASLLKPEHIYMIDKKYHSAEFDKGMADSMAQVIHPYALERGLPIPEVMGEVPSEYKPNFSKVSLVLNDILGNKLNDNVDKLSVEHIPSFKVVIKDDHDKLMDFGTFKYGRREGVHVSFTTSDDNQRLMSVGNYKNGFEKPVPELEKTFKNIYNNNIKDLNLKSLKQFVNTPMPNSLISDPKMVVYTPLELAVVRGNKEMAQLLIDNGAKITPIEPGKNIHDPIALAISNRNLGMVELLITNNPKAVSEHHKNLSEILPSKNDTNKKINQTISTTYSKNLNKGSAFKLNL